MTKILTTLEMGKILETGITSKIILMEKKIKLQTNDNKTNNRKHRQQVI